MDPFLCARHSGKNFAQDALFNLCVVIVAAPNTFSARGGADVAALPRSLGSKDRAGTQTRAGWLQSLLIILSC